MARTALVSATKPQVRAASSAGGGVQEALNTLNALVVAPDIMTYPYSQSVDCGENGRAHLSLTGATFSSTGETDIELLWRNLEPTAACAAPAPKCAEPSPMTCCWRRQ